MPGYELHLPQKDSSPPPWPFILILPILGRLLFLPDIFIERRIARFFNQRGFAVSILRRDFFSFDPRQGIEQIGLYLSSTIEQAKTMLDEILKNPKIDPLRVGSLGISFGGVINVLLSAQEARIKASVVALAGGNLPEIIATSRDPLVKNYYAAIVKGLGMKREEFISTLKEQLKEEPLRVAPKIDSQKIFMMIARLDRVVFPCYSTALWQALGKPQAIFIPLGHYFSLLALPYLNRQALAFFRQKLQRIEIKK